MGILIFPVFIHKMLFIEAKILSALKYVGLEKMAQIGKDSHLASRNAFWVNHPPENSCLFFNLY